jgi:hypothetical protein
MKRALVLVLAVFAAPAWPADTKYRGRFYYGPEVQVFEPCTDLKAYWVKADEKTLKPLIARSEKLREQRDKPYIPLYVELTGRIDTKTPREGFAEDYDGLLHVRKVLRVSESIPKRCRE